MLGNIMEMNVDKAAWRDMMRHPKEWAKAREALRDSIVIT
jgi:hypothetical protein